MSNETIELARYAANLRYEDLPPEVIARAKDCIIDTAAAIIYGNTIPWSAIMIGYARQAGAGGKSRILGASGPAVQPAAAALANGTLSHAFELDNVVINPGAGVHGGATMLPPGLAMAQELGGSGRDLIAAVVAGAEVMIRIGWATKHSNEAHGFHAPGTTGPFGAAIAAGRFLKLDAEKMTNALGIAGSLCGGLMEFARSGTGAMVKRLHIGHACEAGVLAANLASGGFTGPSSVLEGKAGFLRVFCSDFDLSQLTRGLGERFVTLNICLKRYACHITAQRAVEAVRELAAEHKISGDDVKSVTVVGEKRMAEVNNIPEPSDVMMSQYSTPFCVALALYRDPRDPASFGEHALNDPAIRSLCRRVTVKPDPSHSGHGDMASTVTILTHDGRELTRRVDAFMGTPARPFDRAAMRQKFLMLTRKLPDAETVLERLLNLENEKSLEWLGA
ncbi:MAG TPA: MmgE/PrpD family protein [Xanthobacteraceae bacterium]|nr:MmgE/PrpD family protein [Xanthobacteraceae bacterium]